MKTIVTGLLLLSLTGCMSEAEKRAFDLAQKKKAARLKAAFGESAELDSYHMVLEGKDGSVWEVQAFKRHFEIYNTKPSPD